MLVDPAANFVYVVDAGSNQVSEYQYIPATGTLTAVGATAAGASSVFSGAITPNTDNFSNNHSWVVLTSSGALPTASVGADGSLAAGSASFRLQDSPRPSSSSDALKPPDNRSPRAILILIMIMGKARQARRTHRRCPDNKALGRT